MRGSTDSSPAASALRAMAAPGSSFGSFASSAASRLLPSKGTNTAPALTEPLDAAPPGSLLSTHLGGIDVACERTSLDSARQPRSLSSHSPASAAAACAASSASSIAGPQFVADIASVRWRILSSRPAPSGSADPLGPSAKSQAAWPSSKGAVPRAAAFSRERFVAWAGVSCSLAAVPPGVAAAIPPLLGAAARREDAAASGRPPRRRADAAAGRESIVRRAAPAPRGCRATARSLARLAPTPLRVGALPARLRLAALLRMPSSSSPSLPLSVDSSLIANLARALACSASRRVAWERT
mmetsp:Transcript_25910/g.97596  ORF Transcript_25910/g.97596 Transcript_25910/m.97596 type:complete len:298 (-) Transcript_25910:2062-2955(-)